MTSAPYPSLPIRCDIQGVTREVDAIIDTGFDGYLVVPEALIGALPEPSRRRRYRTASGEPVIVVEYDGTVELSAQPLLVEANIIALGDEYLIGIELLNHFRVTLDHGQRVIVEP